MEWYKVMNKNVLENFSRMTEIERKIFLYLSLGCVIREVANEKNLILGCPSPCKSCKIKKTLKFSERKAATDCIKYLDFENTRKDLLALVKKHPVLLLLYYNKERKNQTGTT